MSTITRELAKLFRKITNSEIDAEGNAHVVLSPADSLLINNARIALASLEAEPVGTFRNGPCGYSPSFHEDAVPLYTAPPAPVSVPDERYQHLSELYHAQEKRLFKLAQRIKGASFDKYAYSPSQAIDVLESAIFGEREDECRAAILHGADRPQNETQNIPENIPATQFKPVADLYGLTSPTGGETSFTFDAVEARDFIDGGWLCQEYVTLERYQEAITNHTEDKLAMVDHSGDSNNMVEPVTTAYKLRDAVETIRSSGIAIDADKIFAERDVLNSPVIPDGWVACVERMPSAGEQVLAYRPDAPESNDPLIKMATYVGRSAHGHGFDCYCKPTHWMPLPAAPQQEVTQALAKGMERYGDAMQKLEDSGD